MVLAYWKAVLKCVSAYHTVSPEAVCVLAGIPPIKIVVDEYRRACSTTHRISLGSGKALQTRKGKSHYLNGKNSSLHTRKESGPTC